MHTRIMEFEWAYSSLTVTALAPFLLILAFIFLKSQAISKSAQMYSHIPGPKTLHLIGNLHLMMRASAPHHMFRDLAHKYGGLLHLQLGELHFLIISSVDSAKQLLTTHDMNFASRPPSLTPEILGYNYSSFALAPYGDYWRYVKKIFTLELLSAKRVRSFRHIREQENSNLAKLIALHEGSPINLSKMARMLSFDIIARATVGAKTRDCEAVISVVKQAVKFSAGFNIADLYPSIKWLPSITGIRFKLERMRRRLDKVLSVIIEQHRGGAKVDDGVVEDLVDVLLKCQEDGTEYPLTDHNIKGLLQGIFVAGSDTSATAVEWAMSNMIKSPHVLEKAQEEVRKVFDGENGGYANEDKFVELNYLKLVIKETLRLHPPAPLLVPRINSQRCEINGCEIPAKTRVMINAWALGREPGHWGEDADVFKPERFDTSGMDYKGNNYEYLPFGSGRRACPGVSFAVANMEFTLATLLYHFDWKLPKGINNEDLDMTEEFGATVGRRHPLHLIPSLRIPFND